ncbi:MAG TPA: NAD-dependent epimerase/dehydratase family protein [Streptosporangiaceae bacterium]|nr:NAD-dependent epimerase/dehydratase family protein [Streptosporangiaceae bacterium]
MTGAAGFIGSHAVDVLRAAGHEVQGLDSLAPAVHTGRPDYLPGNFDLAVGDIRDRDLVRRAVAGADVVCHQAALVGLGVDLADLPGYADVNVTGTAVLLEAMGRSGVPRLVLASSMVVYGEGAYDCAGHGRVQPAPRSVDDLSAGRFEPRCPQCAQELSTATVTEDAPLDPRNAYAASKVAQEHLAATWARMTGGSVVALRYHNVYGPRMPRDTPYSGVAAIFRSALEAGRAPQVFEDGQQRRDFVHVRDVARANLAALRAGVPGSLRAFNVASGEPHTVGEMAGALAAAFGGPAPEVTSRYRLGDVRHIVASPDAAASGLGFRAEASFSAGMTEFAQAPLRRPASSVALLGDCPAAERQSACRA